MASSVCLPVMDCRWFEWNFLGKKVHNLALKSSEKKLTTLEGVGLQTALAFNAEGSTLATGGEDGHLRVFKWPSMEIILDQTDVHTTVRDLDFSSDAKSLVSLGNSGPCRVWDLTSSKVEVNLPREDGEVFGFCKFGRNADNTQLLYITAMHGGHGKIITWNTESWKRVGAKRIIRGAISAFDVSTDGKLLAIGTVGGDILVLTSSNMRSAEDDQESALWKCHCCSVLSQDSRFLISASFDNTARVTPIEGKKKNGLSVRLIIFVILLAIMALHQHKRGYESLGLGSF
ncbi:hypothetical protein J5N97_014053 [Dioscorea zingiberensis]|uniref:SEC12-like protein 2 n=1 Tax=Dioscorea zingiberensis TaxID=325984 RepID=A0A9D5CT76_9LILI|nr:hypothetical protein J5N97_014053 [Dioscorea zingiberensis]